MRRRKEVGGWIRGVEEMVEEVNEILRRGDQEIQKRCLRCCPRNSEMLPRPLVDELPMEETVGSELAYGRICGFLKDPQVGIMGLYGMGGVGKTTLLKKINNDFLTTSSDFDVVIWVVVSKPSNIEKIQEVIWNKLQIPRDIWEIRSSKEEKAAEILRVLKTKKFVLLLDDIWERLDLLEMGVPHPDAQNKSKIVFTTRSQDVCHQMKAQKSIGIVAEECKGLPLALVTVGRAMVGEKDPSNWDKLFSLWNTNILSGVETLLEELESLNDINDIRITISSALSLNKLKRSHKLQRCISCLQLHKWGDVMTLELSSSFLKRMEHLQELEVHHYDDVKISMEREMTQNDVTGLSNYNVAREQYFYSLRYIGIQNCSKLLDLTWVVYASCLEVLYVEDCESIELVLHHDHGAYEIVEKLDVFSRLKCLKLNRLPRLKSIYQHPLLFPSLEIIKVYDCKSLRSLPFDSNTSNNNLKKIKGETSWWNQLKWKDETIKDCFTPYFQVHESEAYFAEESETSSIDDDVQEQLDQLHLQGVGAGSSSSGNSRLLLGQWGCDMGMLLDLWASAG
ncbi:hypothetical protein AAG906_014733 [Vitis piasezkii]